MDITEIVKRTDDLVLKKLGRRMSHLERVIFEGAWQDQTYEEINNGPGTGYTLEYLQNAGSLLWQNLSQVVGERVSKNNLRGPIEAAIRREEQSSTEELLEEIPIPIPPSNNGSNPFEYGKPVPPERFYGQKSAIIDIKNRIGGISAQCINIVGMRRSGKTSLLNYIEKRTHSFCSPEQKPLIVLLDLQSNTFHTPEGILEGLRRGIGKKIGTEPWSREANHDPFEVNDALDELRDNGHRLIVVFDEFESISTKQKAFQDWGEDFRSKASAARLTMVIASNRPLDMIYKILNLTSPFDNIFSTTILGSLEEDAWRTLVHKGFSLNNNSKALEASDIKWIDELAGGLPYFTQMAAALLWQYNQREKAKEEFILQATPRFGELWNNLTVSEQEVLKGAAGIISGSVQYKSTVDSIKRYGLLRSDGRLFSSAFSEFIRGQR